jgi:hypothetical protein
MYAPRRIAQRSAITPWSMLGGRGGRGGNGIAAIVVERAVRAGRTKRIRRAGRGFVHNPGRLSASALASRPVRPPGAASSYSRAVLGARGNVWPLGTRRKGVAERKCRNLRTLNNQHFHSTLCILWISGESPSPRTASLGRPAVAATGYARRRAQPAEPERRSAPADTARSAPLAPDRHGEWTARGPRLEPSPAT